MRIRTRSIVITFSEAFRQAVTVLLAIVLVRIMPKETFGTYRQVELVAIFLIGFLGLNLSASLYYFIPKTPDHQRRPLLNQTVLLSLLLSLLMAAVMLAGADSISVWFNNPDLAPLLRAFALFPLSQLLLGLLPPFWIGLNRPLRAGWYTFGSAVIRAGTVIVLYLLGFSLSVVLSALVVFSLAFAALGMVDMYLASRGRFLQIDRRLLREQLSYVFPLLAATLAGMLNKEFNKILISIFFEPEDYAVYSAGAFELPLVGIVTTGITFAIMADLVRLGGQNRLEEALSLWHQAIRKCSLVIYPFFVLFLITATDFIILLFGTDYRAAALPFQIFLLELPVRVAVYGAVLRALGRTLPVAVGAVVGLAVNTIVSFLLIYLGHGSKLAFIGPALGTVIATYIGAAFLLKNISRALDVPLRRVMPWGNLAKVLSLSAAVAAMVLLIPMGSLSPLVRLIIQWMVFGAILTGLAIKFDWLRPDEKDLLFAPFRWFRRTSQRPDNAP